MENTAWKGSTMSQKIMNFDMTYDTAEMRSLQNRLGSLGGKANLIMSRAANRAASTARTVMKRQAAERYFISQKRVADATKIRNATTANPTAVITAKEYSPNLYKFKVSPGRIARPPKSAGVKSRKPPKFYSSQVEKSGGREALSMSPKPFVAQMKNGNIGVFQRKTDSPRSKLKGKYGPAIPQILKNEEVMGRVEEESTKMLLKRIEHEMDRVLKGGGSR